MFTQDAPILGLLLACLALVFHTSRLPRFAKFYKFVPALLMAYFLPAILNSTGIIEAGEGSNLYYVASRYLLPASLLMFCLSIDIKGIINLGPKALIMFFAATFGIVVGGPTALWLVGQIRPDVFGGDAPDALWRGLSTIAGSWIGGGANQTALKEIAQAQDDQFSVMIIVDVFVANLWMPFLLIGAGMSAVIDKRLKADASAVDALKAKVEAYQSSIARIPTFNDLMVLLGVIFGMVGAAHFVGGSISEGMAHWYAESIANDPDSIVRFLSSLKSPFFWLVFLSTMFGVALSFTPMRKYEGAGASKLASVFLYVLVATIGAKMDIGELIASWNQYWPVLVIGLLWMLVHVTVLLVVAKLIKAPFFFVAVGSQANVGGAASAPIVASAFSPALAPVGVLLAVLGYAVGTIGAVVCMEFMRYLSMVG
ncbi:MAG: DUF819 family protein [Flavobacteriales bacterium]|nr:DUF819 family protein [Flavobacteriales bacterium]